MDAKYITCAAKCCANKLLGNSDLTFFTFPENAKLAQIWANNANITYYHYGSTLCAEHFEDKYFDDKYSKKSVFKSDVEPIPTIFNIKAHLEKSKTLVNSNISEIIDLDSDGDSHQDDIVLSAEKLDFRRFLLNSEKKVDGHDYCRLCAQLLPSSVLLPIYGSSNYDVLIEMCLPGKCLKTDELSHVICSFCVKKLENCCSILKSFIDADKELRKIQTKSNLIITESSTKTSVSHQSSAFLKLSNEVEQIISGNEINKNNKKEPRKEQIIFLCMFCATGFSSKEDVITHAFHAHPSSRGNKIISNVIIIKEGEKNKHGITPNLNLQNPTHKFQCNVCKVVNNTKEDLIKHTETYHKILSHKFDVKYMCISCPTIYENSKEVLEHALSLHPQNKIISKTVLIQNDPVLKDKNKTIINDTSINKKPPFIENIRNRLENILQNTTNSESQNHISSDNNSTQRPRHKRPYRRRAGTEISEPTRSYQIKYQCKACFLLFNSYKEVLDHAELLHSSLFKSSDNYTDTVVLLVKVNNEDLNSDNEENNLRDIAQDSVIPVTDGSIIEINPETKPEKLTNIITATNYQCIKCSKLFTCKERLVTHALSKHLTPGVNEIHCKEVTIRKVLSNTNYKKEWYECLICSSHHVTKYSISRHTRFVHPLIGKDKFLCRIIDSKDRNLRGCLHCDVVLKNCRHYRIHMKRHIAYPCKDCELKYKNIHDLREHLKQHEQPILDDETANCTHKCEVCNEEFTEKQQLREHVAIHKIPKDVMCLKCNKIFTSEFDLYRHNKGHETCLCYICGKTYEKGYIRNHLQIHNTGCPYKCKICHRSFKTCYTLSKHKMNYHNSRDIHTMCQVCGKKIQRRSLNLHMRIHTNNKREVCDVCGKAFLRRDHLRLHLKTHMNNVDRVYKCSLCTSEFFARKSLYTHMSEEHGIKSDPKTEKKVFVCTICDKQYTTKLYLLDHYRQHRGERIYSCDVCDKSFGTRLTMMQHKLTHLDYEQFPFNCDVCHKKFKRVENYRNHKRIHTGEKPFACPACERPFRVRGEMIKHMRTHTPKDERERRKSLLKSIREYV